jgi:hypothetical protein
MLKIFWKNVPSNRCKRQVHFNHTWHHMLVILWMHMFEHKMENNFISIFVSMLTTNNKFIFNIKRLHHHSSIHKWPRPTCLWCLVKQTSTLTNYSSIFLMLVVDETITKNLNMFTKKGYQDKILVTFLKWRNERFVHETLKGQR